MNIFKIHEDIISDYSSYISSFLDISDDDIREKVSQYFEEKKLWPQALIQFNPAYEIYGNIYDMIKQGIFHDNMKYVFPNYNLYRHQVEALILGTRNKHFIVTSGTGSGKSLTYIGSIFHHLFAQKERPKELQDGNWKGIKALIVYPMNALINSQMHELNRYKESFEKLTHTTFPITYKQYTGQESLAEKQAVIDELPDIILTNYMMLELIMTRLNETALRESINEHLKFLVFDELHTYRGRQGADVSLLIRRIHSSTKNDLTCIGTSATMAAGSGIEDQKKDVAEVGKKIFGVDITKDQVINETLIRSLSGNEKISVDELRDDLNKEIDVTGSKEILTQSSLAKWIEWNIAIEENEGILVRRKPISVEEIAAVLSDLTGIDKARCNSQVHKLLILANRINKDSGKTESFILPFKLHQFISQTGTVFSTLNTPDKRTITLDPLSSYIIDENQDKKPLFPMVFSRNSGYEFICLRKNQASNKLEPRDFDLRLTEDEEDDLSLGYLLIEKDELIWSNEDINNLPDSWLKYKANGEPVVNPTYANKIPQKIYFDEYGNYSELKGKLPLEGWYITAPLLFDPTSGTFFDRKTSEITKLTKLGIEGRSTSTTILSFSAIKALNSEEQNYEEQKLLSFTDNRQDAALQAGHFNDFYKIGRIRSAIYNAIKLNPKQELDHSTIADEVYHSLKVPQELWAKSPSNFPSQQEENENIFKNYLFYRIILDLKRGWRVNLPNLEQSGLIKIGYKYLDDTINIPDFVNNSTFLKLLTPEDRKDFVIQTLDFFRKNYALNHHLLEDNEIIKRSGQIREEIVVDWGLDKSEQIDFPNYLRVETLKNVPRRIFTTSLGPQSYFGKYLKSIGKKLNFEINKKNYNEIVYEILDSFEKAKWITPRKVTSEGKRIKIFRLEIKSILWQIGDEKTLVPDKIRFQSYKGHKEAINHFFKNYYKQDFTKLKNIEAREHTAQINYETRKTREEEFRNGKISILNCSPTMELGIDIATLNIVHLRNVPPNPSNYAQRSGRAGRSGQAALVLTYCSNRSPHDKHYFKNPAAMVSGIVSPPKIDLVNEELLKSHLNAIYLSEVGLSSLDHSLAELIDLDNVPSLPLKKEVKQKLKLDSARRNQVFILFKNAVKDFEHLLNEKRWYSNDWIDRQINMADGKFDEALNRWRELYKSAQKQLQNAMEIVGSNLYTNDSPEKQQAYKDQKQANRQIDLLSNNNDFNKQQSEFYPFRYLAAEGYLPGYNFTRLPIRAFIPKGDEGEFISRSRFLALREFGPNNFIYHDGSRYKVNQAIINDAENKFERIKVSKNSGYALIKEDFIKDYCPFTNTYLKTDNEREIYEDLLPMSESRTLQINRISCEEEERQALGYDIKTYFTVEGGHERVKTVSIKDGKDELLNIRYIPAATLLRVNEKWRAKKETGFLINIKTGFWKSDKEFKKNGVTKDIRRIRLLTSDTADCLYIHPMKALAFEKGKESDAIITLLYSLKRAIENVFQVESSEIGVEIMGTTDWPNVLIFESAEGSLGILSQLVENINLFRQIIKEAYTICYFEDGKDTKPDLGPATYNDLLSYYNQRNHLIIDRHLIKDQLEKLMICEHEIMASSDYTSYDDQYNSLIQNIDPTSSTEKLFLKYLYDNSLRLPDSAQYRVNNIYVMPDFFYKEGNVCVFCDGTPHDEHNVKERDKEQRAALTNKGYDVVVYYYKEKLEDLINKRSDIFYKVKK